MMVISAPVLSPSSTSSLKTYLIHVERTLKNRAFDIDPNDTSAIARLRQTLTQIEVAQIKDLAIADEYYFHVI